MADTTATTTSDKVQLWCGVFGEAAVFSVKIPLNATVEALRKKIYKKQRYDVNTPLAASNLNLYLARKEEGEAKGKWLMGCENTKTYLKKGTPGGYPKMLVCKLLSTYFTAIPPRGSIHVLVEMSRPPSQYPDDEGRTDRWRGAFFQCQVGSDSLPAMEELAGFLKRPLPVKIRASTGVYEQWAKEIADRQTLQNLVEANDQEQCVKIVNHMKVRIVDDPTENLDATDSQLVWEDLIVRTFTYMLGKRCGYTSRNRNNMASSGSERPNFLLVVDGVCVFRGEEKNVGGYLAGGLTGNLNWGYRGVPYLFGYAAAGFDVKLFVITYSEELGAQTRQLGSYDATNLNDRFELVLALLNLSLLSRGIASLCPRDCRGEFLTIRCESGVVVQLEPNRVVKTLPRDVFDAKGEVTLEVYNLLQSKHIPNVDVLVNKHTCMDSRRFVFVPRGIDTKPRTLAELYAAVRDVLTALVQLHAASWMHRDIRWANVMKRRDGTESWFLIDFVDAAPSPQHGKSGDHLNDDSHAPELFTAGSHSTAVDIWSVGHLLVTSGVTEWLNNHDCMMYTMLLLSASPLERPTASDALGKLTALYQAVSEGKAHQSVSESKGNDSPTSAKKKRRTEE